MKRILLLALVLCLVYPVAASVYTFQDPNEANQFTCYITGSGSSTCNYIHSTNGGNSYWRTATVYGSSKITSKIRNNLGFPMTYAAGTVWGTLQGAGSSYQAYVEVTLYNNLGSTLYSYYFYSPTTLTVAPTRYEMRMDGNIARIYRNGTLVASSTALASNPSYVAFGSGDNAHGGSTTIYWDDIILGGTTEDIFGMPEPGLFMMVKDMTNPAASGFAFRNNGTILNSFNMTTTWGDGGSPAATQVNLINYVTGRTVYTYNVPYGARAGTIVWPLQGAIFNNPDADYGYYTTTIAGSSTYGDLIPYIGYGATVAFDKDTYVPGDTATATYSISDTPYFDPTTYTYRLDFMDVFATVVKTEPIVAQTGIGTYTFKSTDSQGVYYVAVIATPKAGGDDIWMGIDYAELTDYVVYAGYVNDAESATPITGANVSIAQGEIVYIELTPASGEYTTNSTFYSGIATIFNITAAGYYQYNATFTPASAGTKTLNFTLQSKTPTFTGIALGGTCRDSVYGRPINYCAVTVTNATYGESYSVTANNAGYYLLDESDGAHLTNGRWYSVAATKLGFSNSASYLKSVWGA